MVDIQSSWQSIVSKAYIGEIAKLKISFIEKMSYWTSDDYKDSRQSISIVSVRNIGNYFTCLISNSVHVIL